MVALSGRPASPGGPVRVVSIASVGAEVSPRAAVVVSRAGAGPAWSSVLLWQAAIVAAQAAKISIRFMFLPRALLAVSQS
jgi:hypothetical protein